MRPTGACHPVGRFLCAPLNVSEDVGKSGKFWRKHHSIGLAVGKDQVEEMERHYAENGVHVTHRKTKYGDYEPVIVSHEHFAKLLEARGWVDKS